MCLAIPGRLLDVRGTDALSRCGRADFGGVVKEVSLACVPEAKVGDYVLVHVGLAIGTIDAEEARETLEYLRRMGELDQARPPGGPPP